MINRLLIACLRKNKRLILPTLGAFIRKSVDGVGTVLVFVPFLNKDDGVLRGAIESWAGVDSEEASDIVAEYIAAIKNSLQTRGQYIIDGIGVLRYDSNNILYLAKDALKESAPQAAAQVQNQPTVQAPAAENNTLYVAEGEALNKLVDENPSPAIESADEAEQTSFVSPLEKVISKSNLEQELDAEPLVDSNSVFEEEEIEQEEQEDSYTNSNGFLSQLVESVAEEDEDDDEVEDYSEVEEDVVDEPQQEEVEEEVVEPVRKPKSASQGYRQSIYDQFSTLGGASEGDDEGYGFEEPQKRPSRYPAAGNTIGSGVGARYFTPSNEEEEEVVEEEVEERPKTVAPKTTIPPQGEKKRGIKDVYGSEQFHEPRREATSPNRSKISEIYGSKQPQKSPQRAAAAGARPVQGGNRKKGKKTKGGKQSSNDIVLWIAICAVVVTIGVLVYGYMFGGETELNENLILETEQVDTTAIQQ